MIKTDELIRGFSEENFSDWCRGKFADFVPKSGSLDAGDFSRARQIGYVRTLADGGVNRPLLVSAVQVPGELGERSSRKRQFDFARKALQRALDRPPGQAGGLFTQGLFVFYGDGGDFRMSLISGRVEGGKLAYNSFKRQTFFVRYNEVNRTFRDQMEKGIGDYPSLCTAFSIEALTKQFYNELFAWYEWALSDEMDVRFPNDIHTDMDNRELIPEHMIRLITRLMFVWFIKQKHLVPDEIFRVEALRKLLKDFEPDSETEGNYYNAILQNLFFATLNNKIEDREFATNGTTRAENEQHYGVKTLFRNPKGGTWFKVSDDKILDLFEKVPFLNGGLFECLDRPEDEKTKRILYYDGFSREERVKGKLTRAHVPNCLFFNEADGLIPLFQRYNFTVEENSPSDAEVALDPELLGKVFENLLGAYNPETKETARKQSGSFYTPREIVSYMVDESLKQYLKTQVKIDDAALAPLFEEDATIDLPAATRDKLVDAIEAVKILDPACGSGAFPMGALHRLVALLSKLKGQAENLYDLKLHLIENCIYGVDIQTIAVQISKLRFFISLVCEQEPNKRKADNFGILPLPNLETKFVVANTLIGLEKDLSGDLNLEDEEIPKLRKELWDIRHRHFLSKSSQEKHTCRRQDKVVREKIQKRIVAIASTPDKGKIAHLEESIRKLEAEKGKYRGEKWEILSVPTQGDLFGGKSDNAAQKIRVDTHKTKREELDERIQRCERDIAAEKGKKVSRELVEAAEKLAAWNPYDQNASSPFFDPKWMFGVQDGFDVTIGNPPYVRADEQSEWNQSQRRAIMESKQYETLWEKWDLFVPFIERAYQLLRPGGVTTLIVSDAFCHSKYAQKSQEWFLRNSCIVRLDFCSDLQIFEAGVHNLIYLFQQADGVHNVPKRLLHKGEFSSTSLLPSDEQKALTYRAFFPENADATQFMAATSTLDEICYISVGMVIHADEKVAKGAFLTKELVSHVQDRLHPKPFAEGKDLEKWIFPSHSFLEWGTKRAPGMFRRQTFPELYDHSEKLMLPMVGDIRAAIDDEKLLCNHGVFVCVPWHNLAGIRNKSLKKAARYRNELPPRPDLPRREELEKTSRHYLIRFLLAVMNSTPAREYLRSNRRNNIQLYPDDWKQLPIPDVPKEKQEPIVRLVDRILAAKRKNLHADVSGLEAEVDKKVCELYGMKAPDPAEAKAASAPFVSQERTKKPKASRTAKSKSILPDDEGLD